MNNKFKENVKNAKCEITQTNTHIFYINIITISNEYMYINK